jgi:transposase InsO family protein
MTQSQAQLDAFRGTYNEQRPHRAIGRQTPGEAYRALPKDQPSEPGGRGHVRLR